MHTLRMADEVKDLFYELALSFMYMTGNWYLITSTLKWGKKTSIWEP